MSTNKPWDRPWSMEEIIENSDNWSLAGDVALLNTLKYFAENLISKTTEINNNLHNLTNNLEETTLQINIAQNEFQSLRNSQFIESRVYEDDETLPKVENFEKIEEKAEPDHTEDIKLAVLKGLEVIDRYFDKVEVSVSDSEDDDMDLPNYVLRPKDLYIDRPLPYVIGSEEWHKSLHVGLEVSSSDSETEKVSDKFSESDSEEDLPIIQDRLQIKGTSDTSSELDFSQRNENKIIKQDLFQSSDSDDQNSIQASATNRNFAEELAAKLGNVITQELAEPEINRRPIQTKSNYGDAFFEEPPPLDNNNKSLFSGGGGLFDDDDEEDEFPYSTPKDSQIGESPKLSKVTGPSLFDEENSDDEIFTTKKPTLQANKPPLFTEEPPDLDEKKRPVGGVSIFGGATFDKKLLKRRPSSDGEEINEEKSKEDAATKKKIDLFSSDDLFKTVPKEDTSASKKKIDLFDSDEDVNKKLGENPKEVKPISLFDDDDLFKDDLFSSSTTKKFTSGLFDDVDNQDDDLFLGASDDNVKPTKNLFEDLMSVPDDSINVDKKVVSSESDVSKIASDTLFGDLEKSENEKSESPKPKPRISLFDSPPPEPDDLFADEYAIQNEPIKDQSISDIFKDPPEKSLPLTTPIEETLTNKNSIFDSSQSDDQDDLFDKKNPIPTPFTASTPSMRLFDASPPPDDDWETKSENMSDENESITDLEDVATPKTNLFIDEPPSLDFNVNKDSPSKVSNITEKFKQEPVVAVKPNLSSPGKLKHNLSINVGALKPGSLPPKRGETIQRSISIEKSENASFDTPDHVEVLQSVTKDRVRVPLNRRPSTRRGRKAALENTKTDFNLDQEQEEESIKSENIEEIIPRVNTLLLSEDFGEVGKKEETRPILIESKPENDQKSVLKDDLFDDDDADDDDIFSSKKVTVQASKTLKKSSLFDDDDDNDDDDIFKSFASATVVKREGSKIATEKKIPKVSSVKKLENTKFDDDPLSALLK